MRSASRGRSVLAADSPDHQQSGGEAAASASAEDHRDYICIPRLSETTSVRGAPPSRYQRLTGEKRKAMSRVLSKARVFFHP
jgi:hypothetical protein